MPIFRRIEERPEEPYSMCYAVSTGPDPLGPYYRYEFRRKLFPDYPRPAVWPDGYYLPTSTGDNVIQKHACVADRANMLTGKPATEQCVILDNVNFLNNADLDGQAVPPAGAPNIMMAAGGTQLHSIFEDDGIYYLAFHVDWTNPEEHQGERSGEDSGGALSLPVQWPVDQLRAAAGHHAQARCAGRQDHAAAGLPEHRRPRVDRGDSLGQQLAGAGGVRWYEFRLDDKRQPRLFQQGTYAPDGFYRWMAQPGHGPAGQYRNRLFVRRHAATSRGSDSPPAWLTIRRAC